MRKTTICTLLLLVLPALAGCLQDDPAATGQPTAGAIPHDERGVRAGPAPSAPNAAYRVQATSGEDVESAGATAYPLTLESNPAKDPITLTLEGAFEPGQCNPSETLYAPISGDYQRYDVREGLEKNDVFSYEIELTFTNTDESWGDIHLSYGIGSSYGQWYESVGDQRGEITQNFTGQSYRIESDDRAWVAAACWYGSVTEPITYTLTVTYTFAENAVPAEIPVQVSVPEGATRLFVTGVPLDPSRGVLSHYRVFGPDDDLLCECALNSREATDAFLLSGPGEYVVLVDHTANGFVALALDAPPAKPIVPLVTSWTATGILSSEGGAVDETVELDLPRVPLRMSVWYQPMSSLPAEAGGGKQMSVHVTNGRGDALSVAHGAFTMFWATPPGWRGWYGLPAGEWDEKTDHHAFDKGPHQVHVEAEWFRGQVILWTLGYERA